MHFQGYLHIFRVIDVYSATISGVQLGGGEKGGSTALFKIENTDCVHFLVKGSTKNLVLRVCREKTPKCFPARPVFLFLLTRCF